MNFGFNEEQELLRNTARKFFENECPSETVRRLMETPEGINAELWKKLAEQGWLGLIYPEQYDGMALGLVDLVVLMEEMGRAVAPGPYFSTVLLGGLAILEAGGEGQKKEWLPKIAAGDKRVALAWMEPSAQLGPAGVTLTAVKRGEKFALSGTKLFVHDAHTADALVVAARTRPGAGADGVSLFLLPKGTKGLEVTLLPTMDQTRKLCEVACSDVTVGGDALLGAAGSGWAPLARVLDRATVALCAEMCGGAQKVLDMTVEYAKIRQAFGRPIGSYQGVKHRAADMLVDVENSKSITYYAAWALDEGSPEAPLAVSMAKAYVSDAFRRVSAAGIQLHGGIGFTWEHDLHLYFKRAKGSEFTFGDATHHRERVAQLVNL
ncbi:MAG TPA: acyl-CoA dehydrogenase family protein [Candidatus Dormibacteraeota bacterium]|jgi:alkylation response protein AidB-like acyl-CoA dehydrogenase|nr:acyl-CoA dehydrogenase family protein [Candidatus Dormibacteraeota bacterium]